jgi:peptide/nickel transport system substrate-binding protein
MRGKMKFILFMILSLSLVFLGCSSETTTPANTTAGNQTQDGQKKDSPSDSTNKNPKSGGELVIAYDSDVTNYDPVMGGSGNDHALLYPVYDTLVNYTTDLDATPGLAKSWEVPDEKTIIFKLREGVRFHDGTEFNAEAVKFNIERVNSEESKISDLKSVESVEVIDPLTVRFNLKVPDSSVILALSDRGGMMVSPAAVEKNGDDYGQHPVGTGPFKMVNWVRNGEIILEKNEDYWQEGLPYLDKLTVKIMLEENTRLNSLKAGQVDFYWNVSPQNEAILEKDPNIAVKGGSTVRFNNIYLNAAMPPLDKKEVRLAITHAIDRDALVKVFTNGKGEPAYQTFPSGYWAQSPNLKIDYDPEKSKELLKQAGVSNVSFDMQITPSAVAQRLGEALKAQLKEVGINANIQPTELTKLVSMYFTEKTVPSQQTAWTGRPDPQMTVKSLFSPESFYNAGDFGTPEIVDLIAKADATYDNEGRAKIFEELNREAMIDEAVYIPLYFVPLNGAMSNKVKGFEPTLLGKPRFSFLWLEK